MSTPNPREGFYRWALSDDFYRSSSWWFLVKVIKRRDGYDCVRCHLHKYDFNNLCVHHKIEREVNPALALVPQNLETLCHDCHRREHPWLAPVPPRWRRLMAANDAQYELPLEDP